MSHREDQMGSHASPRADDSKAGNRRSSADNGNRAGERSDHGSKLHHEPADSLIQDISHQRNVIKELECKLEQERRQSKEAVDKLLKERSALQYRYKKKELRLQEVMLQFKQFKDNQAPTYQRLRQCYLDPSVNLIFEKMKAEVDESKKAKEDAISDLHAWSFTAESQTGKRLVARCKKLLQENEEFGKMVTSGNVAKLNTEIAMQKRLVDEMHANEKEYDALVLEMDEELDLLTCACKQLQHKLYETVRISPAAREPAFSHKKDNKQFTRGRPADFINIIAASAKQQIEPHQPHVGRQKANNQMAVDYNCVTTSKRVGTSARPSTEKHPARSSNFSAAVTSAEQEVSATTKQSAMPDSRSTTLNQGSAPQQNKNDVEPKAIDVGAGTKTAVDDWRTEKPAKPSKESACEAAGDDHNLVKLKPRTVKTSTNKDAYSQKVGTDSEKRRKPASLTDSAAAAAPSPAGQPITASVQPKNKRRVRRHSSEEHDRQHGSKIQNLSTKENQQSLPEATTSRQDNAADSARRSPQSPQASRSHRIEQPRRATGKGPTKGSRSNWDVQERSPSPSTSRQGARSPVNKSSQSGTKVRAHGLGSTRKFDGRRSPTGSYRYTEHRRRRHSPARNYRL